MGKKCKIKIELSVVLKLCKHMWESESKFTGNVIMDVAFLYKDVNICVLFLK